MDRSAGGDADQDALLLAHKLACGKCVLIRDGYYLIVNFGIEHVGNESCANALNLMAARNSGRKDGRGGRLYGDYLDVGVLALEILAYASDCSARADAGYEDIDLTVGILVYFRTRGLKMRLGVCGIDELSGDKAVLDLLSKLVSLCDCSLHSFCSIRKNKFCTICLYDISSLN